MTPEIEPIRWVAVSCEVADAIRISEPVKPTASKTDLHGTYGEPEVYTEWSAIYRSGREVPVLREHRWPGPEGEPDAKPCEHYVPGEIHATREDAQAWLCEQRTRPGSTTPDADR